MSVGYLDLLLNSALEASRLWFNDHDLVPFAEALPDVIRVGDKDRQRLEQAVGDGLEHAWAFPQVDIQQQHFDLLVNKTLLTPAEGISAEHQYGNQPMAPDMDLLKRLEVRNRPQGPYVLFFSNGPVPEESLNLTGSKLEKFVRDHHWNGLTLYEYLVLQRFGCEAFGNHYLDGFDRHGAFVDSSIPDHTLFGYWHARESRLNIGWCKRTNKNQHRGVHPSMVAAIV